MQKAFATAAVTGLLLVLLTCAGCTPKTAQVRITDKGFQPAKVTVGAGGSVTWTNDGTTAHTVTLTNGDVDSEAIQQHKTFTQKFDKAGIYTYFCRYHTSETGEVDVR